MIFTELIPVFINHNLYLWNKADHNLLSRKSACLVLLFPEGYRAISLDPPCIMWRECSIEVYCVIKEKGYSLQESGRNE
ncbi:MAG: hypothetical protein D4R45_03640 [Planctomycetaceae bacterium]|nr:MAG: hypothetical protein D4R45_03640 [Planctomycetaceae bacterium]